MTTHEITARFGGRDLRFGINPKYVELFEATQKLPALHMQRLFLENAWTKSQVRDVLRFASLPENVLSHAERIRKVMPTTGVLFSAVMGVDTSTVDDTLDKKPIAPYAGLAMQILDAALFGAKEEEAKFSDEAKDG